MGISYKLVKKVFLLTYASAVLGQSGYFFYKPEIPYGSEALYSPLQTVINGSFDILRNGTRSKDISQIQYASGLNYVFKNVSHPIEAIEKHSVQNFIRTEIFPYEGIDLENFAWSWAPNYFIHILGYGYSYTKLAEYYDFHQIPYPKTFSALTSIFYQVMNEAIENGTGNDLNTDVVADVLIFNPIGMILFSFEGTKHHFSGKTKLMEWSSQPMLNPATLYLENAGQNFVIKRQFSQKSKNAVFMYWGIHGLLGFSRKMENDFSISIGAGAVVNGLISIKRPSEHFITPELDGAIGIFLDKENSLMSSILITGPVLKNIRINVYPGLFKTRLGALGFYAGIGEWDSFVAGVSIQSIPVGLSF